MKVGQNFTIFTLFFGIALIEAFRSNNWLAAILFVLLGIMFLRADNTKKQQYPQTMIRDYIKYFKDNPKGYWFKRKLFGWGWVPVRWQGFFVILVYLGVIITTGILVAEDIKSGEQFLAQFLPLVIISTAVLIWICYKKGEKPKWQWGLNKENANK